MTPHVVSHEQLQRRLEVVMRRLCPAWLRTDLDDLVQAAHLKIFRRGGEIGELKSAFLYRVGHSVMVDEIRKVKRRREDFDDLETPRQLPSPSPGPEAFVAGHETGVAIREALSELKPDQRRWGVIHGPVMRRFRRILS